MSLRTDSTAPPFARILVANRGEIAVRIMRTCRDLGIQTVAVYSDADVDAMHVRMADTAVRLGPAPAEQSYLLGDAIIAAAVATGAQAIHPGYGFLSERSAFARAVIDAGVVFIGPTPEGIDALGDKLVARRTVSAQDVPVVPGTFEAALVDRPDGVAAIVAAAKQIGFPLVVKAAAGGGGRGMRRVSSALELPAALASGSAEARAAFGDGSVFLEREVRSFGLTQIEKDRTERLDKDRRAALHAIEVADRRIAGTKFIHQPRERAGRQPPVKQFARRYEDDHEHDQRAGQQQHRRGERDAHRESVEHIARHQQAKREQDGHNRPHRDTAEPRVSEGRPGDDRGGVRHAFVKDRWTHRHVLRIGPIQARLYDD